MSEQQRDQQSIEPIETLIDRVHRRVNIQIGLDRATTAATVSVMLAMVLLVLWKTGWMPFADFVTAGGVLAAVPAVAFGSAWLESRSPVALAQRIDRSHQLHDRLSTALNLADDDRSDAFSHAQIRDALEQTDRVDPSRAVPYRKPADLALFGMFFAGFAVLALFRPPSHAHPLPDPPVIKHDPVLDEATLAMEKERVREMQEALEGTDDEKAEQLVEELDKLLKKVDKREISGKEFLERIDEIEKQHFESPPGRQEIEKSLSKQLEQAAKDLEQKAGEKLKNDPEFEKTVDALENKDLDKASKSLEKLAEKMNSDESLDSKTNERLSEMLKKFADKMKGNREKLEKLAKKHKDLVEKLSEKMDRQGLSQSEKRRLNRAKKELDNLRGDRGDEQNGNNDRQRQLKRLQRKSEQAANDMKQQDKQQKQKGGDEGKNKDDSNYRNRSGRNRKKKARQKKRRQQKGSEGEKSEKVKQMARKQLEELRESMRRSRPKRARNEGKSGGKSNSEESSSDRGEKMREYLRRAKGRRQSDSSKQGQRQGQKKSGSSKGKRQGQQGGKRADGKRAKGESGGQKKSDDPSNAAGDQPGGKALGEKKDSMESSEREDSKVSGRKGPGKSRSEVIRAASEKGFANREYKDVYGEYSPVVEEVMDREDVPPGYRYYVKRYFELIKPRD